MNHHQASAQAYPSGRVASSCLLYGAVGMALALAMRLLGMFDQGDIVLKQLLSGMTSDLFLVVVSDPLLFAVAALFSFGIAFAVLDSPAPWRRMVLGLTALVVLLAMVPVCALWQIYFSPFFVVVAYFWAWFCTMMYTSQHIMPCDSDDSVHVRQSIALATSKSVEVTAVKPKDPSVDTRVDEILAPVAEQLDSKYKPKE